jgi:FkbM family methyltransferase
MGAWNEPASLVLRVDPNHPATNFVEGTTDYDEARIAEFDRIEVPTDTIDSVVEELALARVDLVSITTNGAEAEILQGMGTTIGLGLKYICLARTGDDFVPILRELGFESFSHDDSGFTYRRVEAP